MRRRLALLVLGLLLGTFGLVLRGRGADDGSDAFVGTEGCIQCHALPWQAWRDSNHHLTLAPPRAGDLPPEILEGGTVLHAPGSTTFHHEAGRFTARTLGADGRPFRFPLTYVVGRRRINMYLTTLEDGRLQVLPAMREVPTGVFFDYTQLVFGGPEADPSRAPIVAPGDPSFWTGPVRAFGPRCMGCHVSGERVEAPTPDGKLGERTWRALGIDCEECHGPGAAHVAHQGGAGGEDPILSFTGLSRHASVGVCLRCHMEGEKIDREMAPGQDIFEHLDPTLLDDASRVDARGRPLELIYDGLSFLSSRCVAEGRLTCTTCHDPHGSDLPGDLIARREDAALCAPCHQEIAAEASAHAHHPAAGPGGRCTDCHMPPVLIERGHGVMTDHTLSIPRPTFQSDRVAIDACTACHEGRRGTPPGAPPLDAAQVQAAWRAWWPDAPAPHVWETILGEARADDNAGEDTRAALLRVVKLTGAPRVARASAVRLLGRHADAAREDLLALAKHPDSLVRREAIGSLASLRGEDVDACLLAALDDVSKPVRRRAARVALEGWTRVQENATLLGRILPVLERDAEDVPDDDTRWFRLAAARELAGDPSGAIDAYARQVVLDRLNPYVPRHLERLRAAATSRSGAGTSEAGTSGAETSGADTSGSGTSGN